MDLTLRDLAGLLMNHLRINVQESRERILSVVAVDKKTVIFKRFI